MTTPSLPCLVVDEVPLDSANHRRISEEELDALERSLRQFGFVQPVVARREDGVVATRRRTRSSDPGTPTGADRAPTRRDEPGRGH